MVVTSFHYRKQGPIKSLASSRCSVVNIQVEKISNMCMWDCGMKLLTQIIIALRSGACTPGNQESKDHSDAKLGVLSFEMHE